MEEIDQDSLIYGAVRGMLNALDPHSVFMDPEEFRILTSDTEGRYGGIGVEIDVSDGWLTVISVFEQGPAARAGLQPGDRFLRIDGHPARDIGVAEAVRRMRGEPGTEVYVSVRRPGKEDALELTLRREVIELDAVEVRVLPDRTLLVELEAFQETTVDELRDALDEAERHTRAAGGIRGVILDMRSNPGGLMDAAVLVADEFLREGVIVTTRGRGGHLQREFKANASSTRPRWPMVVLIDRFTASAAEIVAGALKDHRRAVVVGTRSFGKGSVQNVISFEDGSAMKLTTARYYTPNGVSIQAQGIEPDVVVEQLDVETLREARPDDVGEATLEHHLRPEDGGKPAAEPTSRQEPRVPQARAEAREAQPLSDDYQARMAHQILRALIVRSAGESSGR